MIVAWTRDRRFAADSPQIQRTPRHLTNHHHQSAAINHERSTLTINHRHGPGFLRQFFGDLFPAIGQDRQTLCDPPGTAGRASARPLDRGQAVCFPSRIIE
jgi:hypothetical protein